MKATITRVKDGRWFVEIEGYEVTAVFDENEHDQAVKSAYDEGVTDFLIKYSSQKQRAFGREGVEFFILKNMKTVA